MNDPISTDNLLRRNREKQPITYLTTPDDLLNTAEQATTDWNGAKTQWVAMGQGARKQYRRQLCTISPRPSPLLSHMFGRPIWAAPEDIGHYEIRFMDDDTIVASIFIDQESVHKRDMEEAKQEALDDAKHKIRMFCVVSGKGRRDRAYQNGVEDAITVVSAAKLNQSIIRVRGPKG